MASGNEIRPGGADSKALYLELMKKCLANAIYADPDFVPVAPRGLLRKGIVAIFGAAGVTLTRVKKASLERRSRGLDANPRAHPEVRAGCA
jgi:hypothetical protein